MVVKEKDFESMYIEGWVPAQEDVWTPPAIPETKVVPDAVPAIPAAAPVVPDAAPATPAEKQTDEIAKIAADAWTPAEVIPGWATPAEVIPAEVTPADVIPAWVSGWSEVSWDELQKMLDALWVDTQAWAENIQEVKTAAEDIKKSVDVSDTESQKKLDWMIAKIAELETRDQKNTKTIEILTSEYDKAIWDKLVLEYWSANDSKLVSMINESPELKDIISATMMAQKGWDGSKEALIQAHKSALESLTWLSFDSVVAAKKVDEVSAMSAWQDAWTETPQATWDNIYL